MLKELNTVVNYIESHLGDTLTVKQLAAEANMSEFQLHQVFYYLAGMTLTEYIKRRRLSEANLALLAGQKVTDVAYDFGYDSVDGFSRAFKRWTGFLPSDVTKSGLTKVLPVLNFSIQVNGGQPMTYQIKELPAFNLVGAAKSVPMQFEGVNEEIVKLAQSITPEQRDQMHELQNLDPKEVVNASYNADANFMKEEGMLIHMIGVLTTNAVSDIPAGLEVLEVPASTWAVFPSDGPFPETIQQTYAQIYAQWLGSVDYELAPLPNFSFTKMHEDGKSPYSEVWMAVNKK